MRKIAHELIKRAYVQKLKDALVREQLVKQAGAWGNFARAWKQLLRDSTGYVHPGLARKFTFRGNVGNFMQKLYPTENLFQVMTKPLAKQLKAGRMAELLSRRSAAIGKRLADKIDFTLKGTVPDDVASLLRKAYVSNAIRPYEQILNKVRPTLATNWSPERAAQLFADGSDKLISVAPLLKQFQPGFFK